jgi:mRNA interferase RelE/StbE
MAKVVLTDEALEDLRDLDGSARKLVIKALGKLRDAPEQRGTALGSRRTGNLTGFRKLVVGDRQYRIVYRIDGDGSICVVWVVGSRVDEECYRIAVARLQKHADPRFVAEMGETLEALWRRE